VGTGTGCGETVVDTIFGGEVVFLSTAEGEDVKTSSEKGSDRDGTQGEKEQRSFWKGPATHAKNGDDAKGKGNG